MRYRVSGEHRDFPEVRHATGHSSYLLFTSVPRTHTPYTVLLATRLINDRVSFFLILRRGVKHYGILAMNGPFDPYNPAVWDAFPEYLAGLGKCKEGIDHFPCVDTAFPGRVVSDHHGGPSSSTDGPPNKRQRTVEEAQERNIQDEPQVNGIPFDEVGLNIRVGWDRTKYKELSEPYGDRFYDILHGNYRSVRQKYHMELRCDKCIKAGTQV